MVKHEHNNGATNDLTLPTVESGFFQDVVKLPTFDIQGKDGVYFAQDGILLFANLTFFYCRTLLSRLAGN